MKECEFCGARRIVNDACQACGCPVGALAKFTPKLDPYGELAWTVGSDDDFVCFDYDIDPDAKIVYLGSTVNSETGSFIQDFLPDQAVSYADDITAPYEAALALFSAGIDWCIDNEVEYDDADIAEFARAVHAAVTGETP